MLRGRLVTAALVVHLLIWTAGGAMSQDALPAMTLEAEDIAAPIQPLGEVVSTSFRVTIPCARLAGATSDPTVKVTAVAPPWALVTVVPVTFVVRLEACAGALDQHADGMLSVSLTQEAPALVPHAIRLEAMLEGGRGGSARESVEVRAGFFSILDVQVIESIREAAPGGTVEFPVVVTNLGNAPMRVTLELADAQGGVMVSVPTPFVLESRAAGGTAVSQRVVVTARAPERAGYANEVAVVSLRVVPHHVDDPALVGDTTTISLLVTTKGFGGVGGKDSPPLALGGVLGALLVMAWITRRRFGT